MLTKRVYNFEIENNTEPGCTVWPGDVDVDMHVARPANKFA